ncbi:MAG: PAS domain-containing protein, partial [Alphaproteobacteria bacterium]|nr:PAS domain-containing protein [Alphaproteobacteria bacterium]
MVKLPESFKMESLNLENLNLVPPALLGLLALMAVGIAVMASLIIALIYRRHGQRLIGQQAAQQAAQIEDLLAMVNTSPIPLWRRDGGGRLITCNQAYADQFGLTVVEVLAKQSELGGSVIGDQGLGLYRRAMQVGQPQSESHHIIVKGQRRLLEFHENPLPDQAGCLGFALDFTALEDTQQQLARQWDAYADILESLRIGIVMFNRSQRVIYFNTAFAKLWPLDPQWLASSPSFGEVLEALRLRRRLPEVSDFPAYKKQQLTLFHTLLARHEELLHLPDDTTLRMTVVPHPLGGLCFTYDDVSNTLALERSFNTMLAVQGETLSNLYEGVAVHASDGRLRLFNTAFAKLWDFDPDWLASQPHVGEVGQRRQDQFPSQDSWQQFEQQTLNAAEARLAAQGTIERRDGKIYEYRLVPLPDGSSLTSYVDITDQLQVERALRERGEALENADRLKSDFLASMSYELRTPLNSIAGFNELLRLELFGPLNPKQLEYAEGIHQASQHLTTLINDMLDLASFEAGIFALNRNKLDVPAWLANQISLAQPTAMQKSVRLILQLDQPPSTIQADAQRLRQAFYNLLNHAIKGTPDGGTVNLKAGLTKHQRRPHLEILLQDGAKGTLMQEQEQAYKTAWAQPAPGHGRRGGGGGDIGL